MILNTYRLVIASLSDLFPSPFSQLFKGLVYLFFGLSFFTVVKIVYDLVRRT